MSLTTMVLSVLGAVLGIRAARALRDENFRRYLWATIKEARNMYYRYHV